MGGFNFSQLYFLLQSGKEPEKGSQRLFLLRPEEFPERMLGTVGLIGEHLQSTSAGVEMEVLFGARGH